MSNRYDHGERNIALSQDLRNGSIYYDWSITTAFYAAIQFVEHKIFPIDLSGTSCSNISEAKKALKFEGRHKTREYLVGKVLGYSLGAKYKWLEDKSRNARYVSFKITVAEAEKAIQFCNEIKKACS